MSKPVIVLGAGGHAKVLIDALKLNAVDILGITDPDPAALGREILGVPIIGTDAVLKDYSPREVQLVNGLGSVGSTQARSDLFGAGKNLGFTFMTVVHPAAVVAVNAELGEGCQIVAGAIIQPGVQLGDNVVINTGASVDHDCVIGSHSHVAPGVTLSGGVQVGEGSHIGTGALVVQGVHIGAASLIGAGSVVLRDIPEGRKAFGCPAKVVD